MSVSDWIKREKEKVGVARLILQFIGAAVVLGGILSALSAIIK